MAIVNLRQRIISLEFREEEIVEVVEPIEILVNGTTPRSSFGTLTPGAVFTTHSNRNWIVPQPLIFTAVWTPIVVTGRFGFGGRPSVKSLVSSVGSSYDNLKSRRILIVARTSGVSKINQALRMGLPMYSEREFYEAIITAKEAGIKNSVRDTTVNRLRSLLPNALTPQQMLDWYITPR